MVQPHAGTTAGTERAVSNSTIFIIPSFSALPPISIILSGSAAAIAGIVFLASPTIRDYRLNRALSAEGVSPTP